jgi:hypothetical protein
MYSVLVKPPGKRDILATNYKKKEYLKLGKKKRKTQQTKKQMRTQYEEK